MPGEPDSDFGLARSGKFFTACADLAVLTLSQKDIIFGAHARELRMVITCVEIKILRRVRAESARRPPRHRRDTCSMAWRCRFLTARRSQHGRAVLHPTHWLIYAQVSAAAARRGGETEEALFKTEGAHNLFKERGRRAPAQGARFQENRRAGTGHDVYG